MDLGLHNRRALVSGGSRGLGRAIAEELAAEGCALALLCRDGTAGRAVAAEIMAGRPGAQAVVVEADLGFNDGVTRAVDAAAAALGGLDIVVNVAGGALRGHLPEFADQAWLRHFDVKPFGMLAVCRAALPHLERSSAPRIVNIGGIHGKEPNPWTVMGASINASVLGASKALAADLGPKGITVNVVNPGFTATRRWSELIERTAGERGVSAAEAETWLLEMVPLRKVGLPVDVAAMVTFLASDRGGMITGASINVDGGRSRSI